MGFIWDFYIWETTLNALLLGLYGLLVYFRDGLGCWLNHLYSFKLMIVGIC